MMMHYTLLASCLLAMLVMADPPARNQLPSPIPGLERLPPGSPPDVPSPDELKRQEAQARSNEVAWAAERAAYLQLLAKLASAQGISTNAIADDKPATVLLRATILLRAAKDLPAKSAP